MVLTPARAGLLRSNAGRSGYPIPIGVRAKLYAQSNVLRSNASRSNYHSGRVFIAINGVQVGTTHPDGRGILIGSVSLRDVLNEAPTTGQMTAYGFVPTPGQEVRITLGSTNNLAREFAGHILRTFHGPIGSDPKVTQVGCALIDYTWGLDARKVSEYYTGSASTIAAALIAKYAPGYTTAIVPGLPTVVGGITFTNQDLTNCLTQLCKRVGADWACDYHKVVRIPAAYGADTPPRVLNSVHPSLRGFTHDRDLSQTVTRVYVEGGGVKAATTVPPGETILPLDGDPTWYDPAGGTVVSGPQRFTYTGVTPGAGGGLVGTGAAPSGAPQLALASGTGVTPGAHGYAVTFVTAAGESIAGPIATITAGTFAPPATAPIAGTPTPGSGPATGSHDYAVTFVTSSGETLPGPRVTRATGTTPEPITAPVPGTPTAGTGPEPGAHDYAVTFVTAVGETLPGPISAGVLTGMMPGPNGPAATVATTGTGVESGTHAYAVTFVTGAGETTPGADGTVVTTPSGINTGVPGVGFAANPSGGGSIPASTHIYRLTYLTANGGETVPTMQSNFITLDGSATQNAVLVGMGGYFPDARITGRKLYRASSAIGGSLGPFGLVATFNDLTSTFLDTGVSAGAPPPTTDTTGSSAVALTGIATGPSGTTARKIYRRSGGAGLRLLATLNNNSATTYSDTTPSANLGVAPPAVSTVPMQVVPLTDIPTGPAGTGITARKIYRRSGGAGLRLLTTLANNSSTTYSDTTPNAALGAAPPAVSTATIQRIPLSELPRSTSPLVTARRLYGTAANQTDLRLVAVLNTTDTSYLVTTEDAALGALAPASNTAVTQQVNLSGIPVGAPTVTARKIYRTAADQTPLKLLTTIANNTATTHLDAAADATLGAAPPVSDTSGLTQPQGNVLAGSTSLVVASIGAFPPSGWAVIGNGTQVIRYTGVSGNVLTGIPPTGPGSIVASIAFNSTVTSAPSLNGIPVSGTGAIRYPILRGDDVNIWITVNDLEAQAARAQLLGGDGVQEDYFQDRRLARAEATTRAQAILTMKRDPIVSVRYTSRDVNTRAGRTVVVNLGPPYSLFNVPLLIQSVTETFTPSRVRLMPLYAVEASSERLTFEQLIAMIR